MGWAEIRHSFHPLRGQRFEVLKERRLAGVDTLILRELDRGTFSVAREWTDWADPSPYDSLGLSPQRLDADSLFELVALLEQLATFNHSAIKKRGSPQEFVKPGKSIDVWHLAISGHRGPSLIMRPSEPGRTPRHTALWLTDMVPADRVWYRSPSLGSHGPTCSVSSIPSFKEAVLRSFSEGRFGRRHRLIMLNLVGDNRMILWMIGRFNEGNANGFGQDLAHDASTALLCVTAVSSVTEHGNR